MRGFYLMMAISSLFENDSFCAPTVFGCFVIPSHFLIGNELLSFFCNFALLFHLCALSKLERERVSMIVFGGGDEVEWFAVEQFPVIIYPPSSSRPTVSSRRDDCNKHQTDTHTRELNSWAFFTLLKVKIYLFGGILHQLNVRVLLFFKRESLFLVGAYSLSRNRPKQNKS